MENSCSDFENGRIGEDPPSGVDGEFWWVFLSVAGNLTRNDFDHSDLTL